MLAGAPTGLYGHVEENRKRALLLFGGFIVAIELMALVILIVPTMLYDARHNPLIAPLGYLARYCLPVALIGLVIYAAKLWWFVGTVKKSVGFRYVDNHDEPRFCRILEPLAITAGIPIPYAAVIDTPALNAFACGVRANHMVVVATRGLIDGLDDDELAAVLAHEVTHIKHRDTMLLASANTFMATLLLTQTRRRVKLDDWRQAIGMVLLPIFIPLVLLVAFLTQLALRIGYCSRAAIGSAREYVADAEAVQLTKNPAALVSALRKIEGHSRIDTLGPAEEAMMIDGPVEGPLATHPTITERIAALARTTGSLVFEGGTRLDTRPEATARVARVQSFGRRDDELERIATLAQAPPRAGPWEIFRKTRDPRHNLFGFNRRAALIYGCVAVAIAMIASQPNGRLLFSRQISLVYGMGDVGKLARGVARCDFKAIAGTLDQSCSGDQLDRRADRLMGSLGMPTIAGRRLEEQATTNAAIERRLDQRCYSDRFDMTPAALTGPPQGGHFGEDLDTFRRGAARNNDSILLATPGPARDKALKDYVEMRQLLLNDALYFFGKSGMDELNQIYTRDDHQRIIALLNQRLRDPAFTSGDNPYDVGSYRLFATAPFEALPCDVVSRPAG
ncbi:MAG: M48 family metalloprotease [Sphingomicrobium sp.]